MCFAGALRSIVDILQTIGGATLAVTTVVLGASMFEAEPEPKNEEEALKAGDASCKHYCVFIPHTLWYIFLARLEELCLCTICRGETLLIQVLGNASQEN